MKNLPRLIVGLACLATAVTFSSSAGATSASYAHPDAAVLTNISGIDGTSINDTATASGWINTYYSPTDRLFENYLDAGSSVTLTWLVTGSNGSPLANTPVTLEDNLAYSNSSGTTWNVAGLNNNPNTATAPNSFLGGTLSGTTDASGVVTFTVTNTNAASGVRPTDLTTASAAAANEGPYPWSRFLLVVGSDVITDTNLANVNQATDLVDLIVIPAATNAGVTPIFTSPTPTQNGFTTQITNYSSSSNWSASVSPTGSATISSSGLVTVTGVTPGATATVTVTTSRSGYQNESASTTAVATSTGAPGAPSLTVVANAGSITASWTAPSSGTGVIAGYTLTATDAVGTIVATKTLKSTGLSFKISGLTNGNSYTVSVTATNSSHVTSVAAVASNIVPKAVAKISAKKLSVTYGSTMTFTASVSNAQSGTVTFSQGSSTLCSGTLTSGAVSCTSSSPTPDVTTYPITVTYSGDDATRSATATTSLVVKQATPVLALSTSATTFTPSQLAALTVTAGISPTTSNTPQGGLSLSFDGQVLASDSTGTFNVATHGISAVGVGHHVVLLSYGGTTDFKAVTKKITLVVTKDAPGTTTTTTTVPPTTTTTVPATTTTTTVPATTTTTVAGTSLTPTVSSSSSAIGGFHFTVTNFTTANTYVASSTTGTVTVSSGGLVTVTGLAPGASSTVTLTVSRTGYSSAISHVSGTASGDSPTVSNPDTAVLTSVSGTYGAQINDTTNGQSYFINAYYNNTDHWYMNYLVAGKAATMTWHVTGSGGQILAYQPVTLLDNLANSSATGTTWSQSGLNTNPQGALTGTTDASGNVTFTVNNTNTLTGANPSDLTTTAGAESNEGTQPWSCFLLQIGTDVYTGNPTADVNQATDRVDLILIPGTGAASPQATLSIANTQTTNTVSTSVNLTTSGGSGTGAVTFSVTGTGCSQSTPGVLLVTAPHSCVVTATKAASAGYLSATSASVTFTFVANTTPTFAAPDVATLTSIAGINGSIIDDTANAQSWFLNAYFEGSDTYGYAYVTAGSTVTMTWHVTGPTGLALGNQAVTLIDNLGYSGSNGTTWSSSGLTANPGSLSGTTDSQGNVTFTMVNTNSNTGVRPTDLTSNTTAHANESTYPWTRVLLQVGSDVPTANPNTTVNQATAEVDLIVIPSATTVTNYDTTPAGPLLWSETFSGSAGTAVSSSIWTPEIGQYVGVANGLPNWPYGTGEIQTNTANPANVSLDGNGNLAITATCTTSCASGGNWTSARISTAGKANFLYGQLEARIKVPSGSFNWPAFWMLGQNFFTGTSWPNSGEIDIMEGLANNSVDQATLHGNYPGGGDWNGGSGVTMSVSPISNLSGGYHTFGLLWTPNEIQFTLDGYVYGSDTYNASAGTITQQIGTSTSTFTIGGQVWPFDQPFFLILQDAIPAGTSAADGSSGTMSVSWIKYYSYQGYGAVTP